MSNSYLKNGREQLAHDETGAVYILAMFVVVLLLAMAGLAIDAGNIYHARVQLQKATDTGALAGIGSLFLNDNVPDTTPADQQTYIQARAMELAMENLRAEGFDVSGGGPLNIQANYEIATRTLTVTSQYEQNFMLMHLVPFELLGVDNTEDSRQITATAAVRRVPANIALVLDMSTSMACPSEGSCDCKTAARTTETCQEEAARIGTTQKFEELRTAVDTFMTYFDPTIDRISLTLFKKGAQVKVELAPPAWRGFDSTLINNALAAETPGSYTNPSAGLMEAFNDMNTNGVIGSEEATYILFSDGAPTAGRFLFTSPSETMEENNVGLGTHDYLSYSVHWTNSNNGSTHVGPSMLGKTTVVPWNDEAHNLAQDAVPECADTVSDTTSYTHGEAIPTTNTHNNVFASCLENFGSHMPGNNSNSFGSTITEAASPNFAESFRQHYFHAVVNLSDYLRNQKGRVYSIGLGPDAPDDGSTDPYQNVNDSLFRKDVFLSRVANDLGTAQPINGDPHPEFNYDGYQSYEAINSGSAPREGRFYSATSATELEAVFAGVAQKTLLRLIN